MALYGSNIGVNATGTLAVPLPRKFMNFLSQNGVMKMTAICGIQKFR